MIDTVPFDMHCYTGDWHPSDHVSFIDNVHMRRLAPGSKVNTDTVLYCTVLYCTVLYWCQEPSLYSTVTFEGPPRMDQVLWPRHCVQDSWGAQLHQDLKVCKVLRSFA